MRGTAYGHRIAHGALLVGYMSAAPTLIVAKGLSLGQDANPVSLGYDRVRFLKPVFIGDTITVTYTLEPIRSARWTRRDSGAKRRSRCATSTATSSRSPHMS